MIAKFIVFVGFVFLIGTRSQKDDCECITSALCNGNLYYLTKNSENICENLKCNITIESCSTEMTYISLITGDISKTQDIFSIISNNQIVFEVHSNTYYEPSYSISLNTSNKNILQIMTYSASKQNLVQFAVAPLICKCGSQNADCDGEAKYIMNPNDNSEYLTDENAYCGNLQCNISIRLCPTKWTLIKITTNNFVHAHDIFRIISDNLIVFEITNEKIYEQNYEAYILSIHLNTFQAITFSSSAINKIMFSVNSFEGAPPTTIKTTPSSTVTAEIYKPTSTSLIQTQEISTVFATTKTLDFESTIDPTTHNETAILTTTKILTTSNASNAVLLNYVIISSQSLFLFIFKFFFIFGI